MISWLTTGIAVGTRTFALWKVALVATGFLIVSHGAMGLVAWGKGYNQCQNEHAAATLLAQKAHTRWLVETATATGALESEEAATELTNEEIQNVIRAQLAKGSPGNRCLPADFLRRLAQLR